MGEGRFSYSKLLRQSVRLNGVVGTASQLARGGFELIRDSLPSRRRLRFGDLDFDFEQRADTTWSNVRLGTRLKEVFAGRGYQPTDPSIFREMMGTIMTDLSSYTFLDLGSGKGRALLLAREYGFRKIVGLELLPELHEVAKKNIARLPTGESERFELLCGDAREFGFPSGPLFLYLFDPFPAEILAEIIKNLEVSMVREPRPVIVAYQNPVSEKVLAASRKLHKLGGTLQWALYEGTD
jgi:SAM-dependent methyltransferase